jgi:hypothetical protein
MDDLTLIKEFNNFYTEQKQDIETKSNKLIEDIDFSIEKFQKLKSQIISQKNIYLECIEKIKINHDDICYYEDINAFSLNLKLEKLVNNSKIIKQLALAFDNVITSALVELKSPFSKFFMESPCRSTGSLNENLNNFTPMTNLENNKKILLSKILSRRYPRWSEFPFSNIVLKYVEFFTINSTNSKNKDFNEIFKKISNFQKNPENFSCKFIVITLKFVRYFNKNLSNSNSNYDLNFNILSILANFFENYFYNEFMENNIFCIRIGGELKNLRNSTNSINSINSNNIDSTTFNSALTEMLSEFTRDNFFQNNSLDTAKIYVYKKEEDSIVHALSESSSCNTPYLSNLRRKHAELIEVKNFVEKLRNDIGLELLSSKI